MSSHCRVSGMVLVHYLGLCDFRILEVRTLEFRILSRFPEMVHCGILGLLQMFEYVSLCCRLSCSGRYLRMRQFRILNCFLGVVYCGNLESLQWSRVQDGTSGCAGSGS